MKAPDFFKEQQALNHLHFVKHRKLAFQVASLRIILFLTTLSFIVYFANIRELQFVIFCAISFVVLFGITVIWHNRIKFKREQFNYLQQINQEELGRLEGKYMANDNGVEFTIPNHSYADDLDILGDKSIYQLLNRTSTYAGRALLASRLLGKTVIKDLEAYQTSIGEMSDKPKFMQQYQAFGRHVMASKSDYNSFLAWLETPPRLIQKKFIRRLSYWLPGLVVLGFVIATLLSITYYSLLPLLLINLILLLKQHKYATDVVERTTSAVKMLKLFTYHIQLIEQEKFASGYLSDLSQRFSGSSGKALSEIRKITSLLEQLQARKNVFHVFVNIPFLLDLNWLLRIEKWKSNYASHIQEWFTALAEFEVIISLAGQAFAHEDWTVPTISDEAYFIQANGLGHPLIYSSKRVTNNINMQGSGQVILLTGPNMAGKSTFLRTIGVNLVMAKMGGVVCAAQFSFNPSMELFTAMRINDNLTENISSFYAELSRMKQLLQIINDGKEVLFFLDEILKGTNSADRHKGAEALIKQLIKLKASGFVSTHDIELGALAAANEAVVNYSFESIIRNSTITFDYKLRPGICQSFNACELMRQMGIEV